MRLPVAGCRLSSARCGCLGVAMRFCPGSRINRLMLIPGQKSLSRFEKTGVFSRTGTILVAPIRASIVLCANRDNMSISGLAVFRRFCLSGYVDFENWFCPGSQKWAEIAYRDNDFCPGRNVNRLTFSPGQIRAQRRGRGAPQWRWASLWLEANSRPGTMGRGPGRRSRA
mgnify:CR=1 FL=1